MNVKSSMIKLQDYKDIQIDIGQYCVQCLIDTSAGGGLFVNRVPADRQDGVNYLRLTGYLCPDCQCDSE